MERLERFARISFFAACVLGHLLVVGSERLVWGQDRDPCQVTITMEVIDGEPYDSVSGRVSGVDPASVWVGVFVRTNRWYIQPYEDNRAYLPVSSDGTYQTWVRDWNQISAFVVRKGYDALAAQAPYNPFPLGVDCANVLAIAGYPTLQFSGYEWAMKAGTALGPGPNSFRASPDSLWIDNQGYLHLRIKRVNDRWYCAEASMLQTLGYGTYTFIFEGALDLLDRKVIGSPFLYRDLEHEIDIEFSRWGLEDGPNAQYVVQPSDHPGNLEQFSMSLEGTISTHTIHWSPIALSFQSARGTQPMPSPEQILHKWTYRGTDVPMEKDRLFVHVNLWLLNGEAPANGEETEMVLRSFSWKPLGDLNGDGKLDLGDAIAALKILAGMDVSGQVLSDQAIVWADVNGDGKIGLEEAVYVFQKAAGLRGQ
jgi:hypothetical protein